jgi:L-threonylcarbamoyladenylate synthase
VRLLHVDDPTALAAAAAALADGQVIVVPTDTVYGVAARPDDADAVELIYRAKDRPDRLQLPVLASSLEQVRQLGVAIPAAAATLAARWWPGPLTMAFGFSPTAGRPPWLDSRDEVAVRIPQHAFLLALIGLTGPLVVTSANRHGSATPGSAEEAAGQLAPYVELAIDGGALDSVPSTLVNLHTDPPRVEREGAIAPADIEALLEQRPA